MRSLPSWILQSPELWQLLSTFPVPGLVLVFSHLILSTEQMVWPVLNPPTFLCWQALSDLPLS